jgi:ABC-type molybdate transport system substrate-binding protein
MIKPYVIATLAALASIVLIAAINFGLDTTENTEKLTCIDAGSLKTPLLPSQKVSTFKTVDNQYMTVVCTVE